MAVTGDTPTQPCITPDNPTTSRIMPMPSAGTPVGTTATLTITRVGTTTALDMLADAAGGVDSGTDWGVGGGGDPQAGGDGDMVAGV
jgi:hypothetical protein